ncbi:MAG: DUF2218 domain-containing protein [Phyllobacterium sp.]
MSQLQAGPLSASTEIPLHAPEAMLKRICAYFEEYCEVRFEGGVGQIVADFGTATLQAGDSTLSLKASAGNETGLAYVKLSLAEHILSFAAPEAPRIIWTGDGSAGQPLPYFREMRVVRVVDVTPHMRRLTLSGDRLESFATGGFHIRLLIPPKDVTPIWPVTGEDGRPSWPDSADRPIVRIYTMRRIDVENGEVDVDFVMHEGEDMPGTGFAARAQAGDIVGMTGPGGGSIGEADWYLLAGDETALPAIGRILETLPETARGVALIEISEATEEQPLKRPSGFEVRWLYRKNAQAGTTTLLQDAVSAVEWPTDGSKLFAWAGCEHESFKAIRRYLRNERKMAREDHLVVAYWRRDARQGEE